MKSGIHPTYHPKAKVKCACGATYDHFRKYGTKPLFEIGKFKADWFKGYRNWKNDQYSKNKPNVFKYCKSLLKCKLIECTANLRVDNFKHEYKDKIEGLKDENTTSN